MRHRRWLARPAGGYARAPSSNKTSMTILLILLVPVAIGATLALITRTRALGMPAAPTVFLHEGCTPHQDPPAIPKIIWSYWHTPERPLTVEWCLHSWVAHNPGWTIRSVHRENLAEFVDLAQLPAAFHDVTPMRQSDWLRLYFLRRYGGVWLDASFILTESLDWLIAAQTGSRADYLGFYLDKYTTRPDCPIIDSWCMAAPAGSRFVEAWFAEFSLAMTMGDAAYLASLQSTGGAERLLQKLPRPDYLMIHVTAQRVLERGGPYRLHLIRAEDSAYYYQALSSWKRLGFFTRILLNRRPHLPPPLIKLRGGERRKLEPYLRHRLFSRHSIVGTHLDPRAMGRPS